MSQSKGQIPATILNQKIPAAQYNLMGIYSDFTICIYLSSTFALSLRASYHLLPELKHNVKGLTPPIF